MTSPGAVRLTQYARGGGCACKIPPGELEETVGRLMPAATGTDLMVGVEHGDDGAVVRVGPAMAVVVTADFFTPVVDDAYTFGRIAATRRGSASTTSVLGTWRRGSTVATLRRRCRPFPGPAQAWLPLLQWAKIPFLTRPS